MKARMKPSIEEIALPRQVICGDTKCCNYSICYHAEPHDDEASCCWSCGNSHGCLPVEEAIKLATIEAAEDEGQRRML